MLQISLQKQLNFSSSNEPLDVQLNISKGSLTTLYGQSGAGKTSILRMIAGLMSPDMGHIIVDNSTWLDTKKKINLSPQERNIGFVFQDYALFPNMTVLQNLEFALKKGEDKKIISELIEVVELTNLKNKKPKTLSGGQQQRVALARALVQRPQVLLLDEPLSALDSTMREKLQGYLLDLHRRYELTTILVSHDEKEIIRLSDTVILLKQGNVIQTGSPSEMFKRQTVLLKGIIKSIVPFNQQFKIIVQVGDNLIEVQRDEINDLRLGQPFSFEVDIIPTAIGRADE